MAFKKISDIAAQTTSASTDLFEIETAGGVSKKVARSVLDGVYPLIQTAGKTIYVSKSAQATDTRTGLSAYDSSRPFATLTAAVASWGSGDVIRIAPGAYAGEGVGGDLTLPSGCVVIGAGRGITTLTDVRVIYSGNLTLEGCSILSPSADAGLQGTDAAGAYTVILRNVEALGRLDGLYVNGGVGRTERITGTDSIFRAVLLAEADQFTIGESDGAIFPSGVTARFDGCRFSAVRGGISASNGADITAINCEFIANSVGVLLNEVTPIAITAAIFDSGGSIKLHDCELNATSDNDVYKIWTENGDIMVWGTVPEPYLETGTGTVTGSYTDATGELVVNGTEVVSAISAAQADATSALSGSANDATARAAAASAQATANAAVPSASVSAFGGTLIDDSDAATARATLRMLAAVLASNQVLTNQAVLQDATGLSMSLEAGTWVIEINFTATMASATPGITYRLDSTQTPSYSNVTEARGQTGSGSVAYVGIGVNANRTWNGFTTLTNRIIAIVNFAATSTVKFQFSQSVSGADAVTLSAGSVLMARRVD